MTSDAHRINDHHARAESRKAREVCHIERQQVRHSVDVADRHEPSVMNLFTDNADRPHKSLPCGIDARRFVQQRERRLETRPQTFRRRCGLTQTVRLYRPRGEIAKLDQVLRR